MATVSAELEKLKWLVSKGRGNEPCHVILIEEEQKKRIKNERKSTRFVLVCDTPEAYSELHTERERIFKRVRNKSVAISLMIRCWREGLSDPVLDEIVAQMDAIEAGAPGPARAEIPTEL
jgi:hypothetical protein